MANILGDFKHLVYDFSDCEDITKTNIENFLANKDAKVPTIGSRLRFIPLTDGEKHAVVYAVSDLHGDYASWKPIKRIVLNGLAKGENIYLADLGDDNDALPEKEWVAKDGKQIYKPVLRPLTDSRAEDMFNQNLAYKVKIGNEEMYALLSYPDNSFRIIAEMELLETFLPNRIIRLGGNHGDAMRGHPASHGEITHNIMDHLEENEKTFLKNKYSAKPVAAIAGNWWLSHAGPASTLKSRANLEQLTSQLPIKNEKFEENYRKYIRETPDGQLSWGLSEELEFEGIPKKRFRVFRKEDRDAFYLAVNQGHAEEDQIMGEIYGHSAGTNIAWEDSQGNMRYILDGLSQPFQELAPGQVLIASAEHRYSGKARSGTLRDGPNTVGGYICIKLRDKFGKINSAKFGERPYAESLGHYTSSMQHSEAVSRIEIEDAERERDLVQDAENAVKEMFIEKGLISGEVYDRFMRKNLKRLRKGVEGGNKKAMTAAEQLVEFKPSAKEAKEYLR
ncbi:hypothetical protein JXB27_02895 [Candidatus Woesearchaeota archaeon]|nr:hypothetical protein [Candidatus Woesearchaeota archaeon]